MRGRFFYGIGCNDIIDGFLQHLQETLPDRLTGKDFTALCVNYLTLLVHYVIILDQVFAYVKVMRLNFLLRILNRLGDHAVRDCFAFFNFQQVHDLGHAFRSENAKQVIFQRQIELGRTRIALTAGTAA